MPYTEKRKQNSNVWRVIAPFIDYQWDVDTADMRRYEDQKFKYFVWR